jgi:methylated-DNA-[protein]-cysteine S-methyltransferase
MMDELTYQDETMKRALDALYARGPDAAEIQQAQAKLRRALAAARGRAARERIVYYDVVHTSEVGALFVAVSERGLLALDFGLREEDFISRVQKRSSAVLMRSREHTAEALRQVREYLTGRRASFDLPLDMTTLSDFQRTVLKAALKIPRGQYRTYREVATAIGKPKAARAVGQALGHNPVPIVIPCHRVLGSDGSLHGYSGGGGLKTKAWLLQLEGAHLPGLTKQN